MGTDCTMVVEILDDSFTSTEYWEIAGVIHLNRHYDLFDEIKDKATPGYPNNINHTSKYILDEMECWGECWMSMNDFKKLKYAKSHKECNIFKKRLHPKMRCIFRFDN